jgi:D-3-phosphoglycerate dehydrogenase
MAIKVAQLLVVDDMPDYGELFKQAGLDVELTKKFSMTEEEILANAGEADAIIGIGTFQPFSEKVMAGLTKCRLISSLGIGYDQIDVKAATKHGILVTNVPDYCWEELSDHIMGLILACSRKIVRLNQEVKKGAWQQSTVTESIKNIWPGMIKLKGRTLGMIGFGGVSRSLVPKARGFGLHLMAYDPFVSSQVFTEFGVEEVKALDRLLSQADIVITNTNLTPETTNMIGLEQFRLMKPTACIINTARGKLIDPEALRTALTKGLIDMAGLDVTEPEPLAQDDPLLNLDNVIITAHSGHYSETSWHDLWHRPGENIVRLFRDGQLPPGLLNPEAEEQYRNKWGGLK